MNTISRICIFVFYDPHGIVDRYVTCLMDALRTNADRLIVVSNCPLAEAEAEKLRVHCDNLFFRENRGLDAAAFKDGMIKFCGWEQLEHYDEVVLVNDTFFGPIHSFTEMFAEMDRRDLDFWGMSAGYRQEDGWGLSSYGYIPDHIQTFFVAFRQNMVSSQAFHDYWNHYDDTMNTFREVVSRHEMIMTKHFEDLGFRWGIYAKSESYRSRFPEENFNNYFFRSSRMMEEMDFPVFKKKVLCADMADVLYMNDLEDGANAMKYIQDHSDYDPALIYENVLRLYNVEDLYHSLHLNYVLSSEPAEPKGTAALVFYLTNPKFAEAFTRKAQELCTFLPVFLIPEGEALTSRVCGLLGDHSPVQVLKPSGQDTEMGAFVLCCKDLSCRYEYLGFLHDLQNPNHDPATIIESTVYGYLCNAARDCNYISQILQCFEKEPQLGILGTPAPIHHNGFGSYGNGWGEYYSAVAAAVHKWNLRCSLSQEKQPLAANGTFWCRTAALMPLLERQWSLSDFKRSSLTLESQTNEVLKRILPYAAQSAGYFTGIVMHADYASMRITGQEFMLQQIVGMTKKQFHITSDTYVGYRDQLKIYGYERKDSHTTVDLSDVGVALLAKMILLRFLPEKAAEYLRKVKVFLKRKK